MHSLLKNHFEVQTGMYFDYFTTYGNWMISMSNIIEDSFWNYAVIPENCNLEKELPIVEEMLRRASRPLSVYVINEKEHSDYISCLLKHGYNKVSEESFMTYDFRYCKDAIHEELDVIRAVEKSEMEDFIDVFMGAYGGEITPEQPYGELDKTYVDALTKSFENTDKFYHYICRFNGKPVAFASLCFENNNGGIYNVGTNPSNRGCGYGTLATVACIKKWMDLGGKTLFLQTETGSKVESWYYSLGFKLNFYGSTYCKEE